MGSERVFEQYRPWKKRKGRKDDPFDIFRFHPTYSVNKEKPDDSGGKTGKLLRLLPDFGPPREPPEHGSLFGECSSTVKRPPRRRRRRHPGGEKGEGEREGGEDKGLSLFKFRYQRSRQSTHLLVINQIKRASFFHRPRHRPAQRPKSFPIKF